MAGDRQAELHNNHCSAHVGAPENTHAYKHTERKTLNSPALANVGQEQYKVRDRKTLGRKSELKNASKFLTLLLLRMKKACAMP